MPRLRRDAFLPLLLAGAFVFAVWSPSLTGAFLKDDESNFTANPAVAEPSRWPSIFYLKSAASRDPELRAAYRPLATLSYALNARLTGLNVFFFHLADIAGHAANAVLVLLIGWELCSSLPAAAAGALLFALHPAQAESVSYVSGARPSVFSLLFCLLSLRAHLRGRRGASFAFFAVAALFKESALALPLALAVWDRGSSRKLAPHFAFAVAFTLARALILGRTTDSGLYGGALASHLVFAFSGLTTLARSVLSPYGQSVCYTLPAPPTAAPAVIGALLLGGSAASLIHGFRFRRAWLGPLALAIAFILPVSNLVIPVSTLAADRYLYASFAGLAWLLALALARVPKRWAAAPALALALWLLPLCLERQWDWQSAFTIDAAAHAASDDACASTLLLVDYFNWGMKPRARELLNESLSRHPSPALRSYLGAVKGLLEHKK